MALKNVHHFWKMLETVTRDDAHFSMTIWIFELINMVFELGLIIHIKYLLAPIILQIG